MNVAYEVYTLVIAAIVIATISIKLYRVGLSADAKLSANATQAQKISIAVEAIVKYLIDHKITDQELLAELQAILSVLVTLGVDVKPLQALSLQLAHLRADPPASP